VGTSDTIRDDRLSTSASIMKTEPTPSDREVIAGLVERVTYQNAENGFCVIRIKGAWPP
jgi:hypothetical protein